ncbi:unnamed protein product [Rotaria sp. Silwood2]|nr:unnamed protein product [Rotaria sp. Silwood2]CAF4263701.1 unnamed protein product [Rotaria sp. Silwood2]
MHTYFVFLTPLLARVMLVLASVDRYCFSTQLCQLHSTNTIQRARIFIVISTILCVIYMSPMLIMYYSEEPLDTCLQYSNGLINIYIFSQILVYYIPTPLFMIIFGLLTISNARQHIARIGPQVHFSRSRRTERQLTRMLLLQLSCVSILFALNYQISCNFCVFHPITHVKFSLI